MTAKTKTKKTKNPAEFIYVSQEYVDEESGHIYTEGCSSVPEDLLGESGDEVLIYQFIRKGKLICPDVTVE
jgi:hypothetical protein